MLNPKTLTAFDEATALGIATLWNDAIPAIRHRLDHQIDDIDDGIRLALECDRDDCETHDVRHRDADDCPCWGCDNTGLLTMAQDLRHWLDDLDANGTAYGFEAGPDALLGLVTEWLYVNANVPRSTVPAYQLGPMYRLAAELADQTNAKFTALASGQT